ncbi:MAG TPA: M20/M25/M40 family metallo-hydrolase [Flavobacteriaceae bacterium]|nr:M20/M25/M40 family metallo-hydrolase [Flavobacteriaceae bacterium]
MKKNCSFLLVAFLFFGNIAFAQKNQTIQNIIDEARNHSQLKTLAHELLDVVGPRLVGTPQMLNAHNWAVEKFKSWGIPAENQEWGKWQGWERGITHIDMVSPRIRTLSGRMLAWSPGTDKNGITAEVITLPKNITDSLAFQKWLPTVKGKFVLVSMQQPTGRPNENWEEYATEATFEKMKQAREVKKEAWEAFFEKIGYTSRTLPQALEKAGAVGVISSNWSRGFGVNKVFGAHTDEVPSIDLSLEDYGLLYRLAKSGHQPEIKLVAQSKDLGMVPTFNTIARIEGTEKPEEYVILSAHFDSWDGATGATDNGSGSILMMETARVLKKVYPNPKRTILIGLWGSEEQGLNGSRAFVEDHPKIVKNIQAVFNQDNGTGRVVRISGSGFLNSYDYLGRWLSKVPDTVSHHIETTFPGRPGRGGTDYASFLAAGAPAFNLTSLSWAYWNYTWHTNRDTYDKLVFDEIENNVILTAILAYMASEDPETTSREQRVLPIDEETGERRTWPEPRAPERKGGMD